jgi:hypothetical protein
MSDSSMGRTTQWWFLPSFIDVLLTVRLLTMPHIYQMTET